MGAFWFQFLCNWRQRLFIHRQLSLKIYEDCVCPVRNRYIIKLRQGTSVFFFFFL